MDIIDKAVAERTAKRDDAVGQLVLYVLRAPSPDDRMKELVPPLLSGYLSETRKLKITMLAAAFGADRLALKKYLRAHILCGPAD